MTRIDEKRMWEEKPSLSKKKNNEFNFLKNVRFSQHGRIQHEGISEKGLDLNADFVVIHN